MLMAQNDVLFRGAGGVRLNNYIQMRLFAELWDDWFAQSHSRPLDSRVFLFRSDCPGPPNRGWKGCCSDLTVIPVAGDHHTMFDAEHLEGLVTRFVTAVQREAHFKTQQSAARSSLDITAPKRVFSNSDSIKAKVRQGFALHQQGSIEEAERIYEEILKQDPTCFDAQHHLGVLAVQSRQIQRGVELIAKAIELNPNVASAHNNLGHALSALKRHEEALASYDKAIALKPDFAQANHNRGNALITLERYEEALASYDKTIALKPRFAQAYNNRGNALNALKGQEEALASYDMAIRLKPDFAEAHNNRGNVLYDLGRHDEARVSYDRAIALKPSYAEAYSNRGNDLKNGTAMRRHSRATTRRGPEAAVS